jgi:hypothetical protein
MSFKCDTCDRVLKSVGGKSNHMRRCGIFLLDRHRRKRRKKQCDTIINDVKCDTIINDVKCDTIINDVECILCYNIIKKDSGGFKAYIPCIGGITEHLYKCKHCMKDTDHNDSNERFFWETHRNGVYMYGGNATLSPCPNVWCWFGY